MARLSETTEHLLTGLAAFLSFFCGTLKYQRALLGPRLSYHNSYLANETSGDPNRLPPINGKLFKKIGIKEEWLE